MKTYKCKVCGEIFQVPEGETAVCPRCRVIGDKLEEVIANDKKTKYAGTQTEKNLQAAFAGESQARNKYTYYASKAKKDGYVQIANIFEETASNEKEHEERYRKLLANVEGDLVFSKDNDVIWQCLNCGHIYIGQKAPELCAVCKRPQSYFQVKAENY